jgi:hypothetical protein
MADVRTWQTVHSGEVPELVLAADFPMTGRTEGGFADLAAGLHLDCTLWQTVPQPVAPDNPLEMAEYIQPWLREVRADGRAVRAVMGYCAGAVIASALVTEIAAWQDSAPRIVLFDPETVTVPVAHIQFGRVIGNMTSVLSGDEITLLQESAQALAGQDGVDVPAFASGLFGEFRPVGLAALGRAGVTGEFADELIGLIGSFMSYLSAASSIDPRPGWRQATAISSETDGSGLSMLHAGDGESSLVAAELSFAVEHQNLLRDDRVAKAVAELLETS